MEHPTQPERIVLLTDEDERQYRDLRERIEQLAARLAELAVEIEATS